MRGVVMTWGQGQGPGSSLGHIAGVLGSTGLPRDRELEGVVGG